MATEQVYDPNLGGERDAFPGEVVPPEQQKTLQRLMQEGEGQFRKLYDEVAESGQLTPEELNGILKAGKIRAERERQKYLEGIRQNPANIIQGLLKECKPEENNIVMAMLGGLNNKVKNLEGAIASAKIPDQLKGADKSTLEYIIQLSNADPRIGILLNLQFYDRYTAIDRENRPTTDQNREQIVFETLKKLGLVPAESLRSFADLYSAVRDSGNTLNSGKPYAVSDTQDRLNVYRILNLSSNRPGLEGIEASFELNNIFQPRSVAISSTPEALARIVDRGGYVPYNPAASYSAPDNPTPPIDTPPANPRRGFFVRR